MNKLPQHKATTFLDFGVVLHPISSEGVGHVPVSYSHQDDFFIFGWLSHGTACGIIDFKEIHLEAGDAFIVQPGQVHRFICSDSAEGWLAMVDSIYVGHTEMCIFNNFSLFASVFSMEKQREVELESIASLIVERLRPNQEQSLSAVLQSLTKAFVAVIAEAVKGKEPKTMAYGVRHRDIVLSFRAMLDKHIFENRQPSYYASLLNFSTVYLNEVVKKVTGMSTALYIKNEVMLRAKRMLVNTDFSVKQIADKLGFDDYAYFSRSFSQVTGMSPLQFRQKNIK